MHKKSLIAAALAVAAIGIGASSASAATLYTTSAHTTVVPVGTTFSASTPLPNAWGNFTINQPSGLLWESCDRLSMQFQVTQNSAGLLKANMTTASTVCHNRTVTFSSPPTVLQVAGSSTAVGTDSAWLGTTLSNVSFNVTPAIGSMTGSLVAATGNPPDNGMFSRQPTAAKTPITIVMKRAGTLTGNWFSANLTAAMTLTGAAASYSLN